MVRTGNLLKVMQQIRQNWELNSDVLMLNLISQVVLFQIYPSPFLSSFSTSYSLFLLSPPPVVSSVIHSGTMSVPCCVVPWIEMQGDTCFNIIFCSEQSFLSQYIPAQDHPLSWHLQRWLPVHVHLIPLPSTKSLLSSQGPVSVC